MPEVCRSRRKIVSRCTSSLAQFLDEVHRVRRALDVLADVARVRETLAADERMRAEAEAVVLAARPVAEVVATLLAGPREVADLVLAEPRASQSIDRFDVGRSGHLVIRNDRAAARDLHGERRLLFEIEHVQRDVPDSERDGFIERLSERLRGLVGQPRDQIETRAHAARDRERNRLARAFRTMDPSERHQLRVVERLNPDAEPVDTQRPPQRDRLGTDVFRIGFHGELGVRRDRESLAERRRCARDSRGSSSTECRRRSRRTGGPQSA